MKNRTVMNYSHIVASVLICAICFLIGTGLLLLAEQMPEKSGLTAGGAVLILAALAVIAVMAREDQ